MYIVYRSTQHRRDGQVHCHPGIRMIHWANDGQLLTIFGYLVYQYTLHKVPEPCQVIHPHIILIETLGLHSG